MTSDEDFEIELGDQPATFENCKKFLKEVAEVRNAWKKVAGSTFVEIEEEASEDNLMTSKKLNELIATELEGAGIEVSEWRVPLPLRVNLKERKGNSFQCKSPSFCRLFSASELVNPGVEDFALGGKWLQVAENEEDKLHIGCDITNAQHYGAVAKIELNDESTGIGNVLVLAKSWQEFLLLEGDKEEEVKEEGKQEEEGKAEEENQEKEKEEEEEKADGEEEVSEEDKDEEEKRADAKKRKLKESAEEPQKKRK
eukprot:Phypoly_transcript_15297.p1 GENE.Phypoly_transcript_15297~~Phypoly_transcript_15297.p1  ORF type:complete len:298 (+),score=90.22 Phypoly_transcript_15297:132-896(+)